MMRARINGRVMVVGRRAAAAHQVSTAGAGGGEWSTRAPGEARSPSATHAHATLLSRGRLGMGGNRRGHSSATLGAWPPPGVGYSSGRSYKAVRPRSPNASRMSRCFVSGGGTGLVSSNSGPLRSKVYTRYGGGGWFSSSSGMSLHIICHTISSAVFQLWNGGRCGRGSHERLFDFNGSSILQKKTGAGRNIYSQRQRSGHSCHVNVHQRCHQSDRVATWLAGSHRSSIRYLYSGNILPFGFSVSSPATSNFTFEEPE